MIRGAFGAFDALVGARGANSIVRRLATRQLGARKVSTKALQGPVPWHHRIGAANVSQLWAQRLGKPSGFLKYSQARVAFRTPKRSFHSSKTRWSSGGSTKAADTSLSGRLKKLSREYGWAAVGIYLGLSILDFPFCFLLVRTLGTDRIAVAEEFVVSNVKKAIPESVKTVWHEYRGSSEKPESEVVGHDASTSPNPDGWGVKEADERNKSEPSLATQLALAYAIHKSFIFLRVPLTAAVTPKVVKVLRSWGWQIGKRRTKG